MSAGCRAWERPGESPHRVNDPSSCESICLPTLTNTGVVMLFDIGHRAKQNLTPQCGFYFALNLKIESFAKNGAFARPSLCFISGSKDQGDCRAGLV